MAWLRVGFFSLFYTLHTVRTCTLGGHRAAMTGPTFSQVKGLREGLTEESHKS